MFAYFHEQTNLSERVLQSPYSQDNAYWKQQSRALPMKDEDRNLYSKYFHLRENLFNSLFDAHGTW